MRIGITEAGDAALDLSWSEKMYTVDAAILITKRLSDEFIALAVAYKDKVIVHATITGFGDTIREPHVGSAQWSFYQLRKLIEAGFPVEQIVVRIDPIIPTTGGILKARRVIWAAYKLGVKRFRISVLDAYPHVRARFVRAGIQPPYGDNFSASEEQFAAVDKLIADELKACPGICVESCAEPQLKTTEQVGCISAKDMEILDLNFNAADYPVGLQRRGCLCPSCKTELLNNKKQCAHGCLYCYWCN